ncbi:MAG: hypothetical protein KDK03_07875 [Rhodobacteraceae bacterium]|nr:hypothetical protein [Paracoccaceae bacterium]
MKVLNPAALKRRDFNRLGKYLLANGVKEITITRADSTQTMKFHKYGFWRVTKEEVAQ